jgi:hypothetical protein
VTLPTPKPSAFWDEWFNAFEGKHGRTPFFDELVRAIQADARGEEEPAPLTDEGIAALADFYHGPTVPPPAQAELPLAEETGVRR